MRFVNDLALNAVNNSGTATSAAIDSSNLFAATAVATFTDNTAAGTLKFQGSNDAPNSTPSVWVDIPSATTSVSSGAISTAGVNVLCFQWIRVVFVSSGGAGTLTARLKASGF